MFDIGFAELLIIAVVGLLVIGPERLPGAIRTGSAWLNRFRRGFNDIKQEVQQELHNDAVLRDLRESGEKLRRETQSLQRDLTSAGTDDGARADGAAARVSRDEDKRAQDNDGDDTPTAADQSAGHRETPAPFLRSDGGSDTSTQAAVDGMERGVTQNGERKSGVDETRGTKDAAEGRSSDEADPASGRES